MTISPIKRYLPISIWLPRYQRAWLRVDFLAGITVWGTSVPTAMGYAQMAGLPLQTGLYAAMVALFAYAVFGSSPLLKVETSPSMAVMSAAFVAPMALGDVAYYITLSAALALFVGVILIAAGLARMGFLADFLAKPVVAGFLFGLAVMIVIAQLPTFFGLESGSGSALNQLGQLITSLDETNLWTLAVSLVSFIVLLWFRRFYPRLPGALILLLLGIVAVSVLNLEERGVAVVGYIPSGLPAPQIPFVQPSDLLGLLVGAMAMVFVALGESLGTARTFAAEHRSRVETDQELLALGVANLGSGLMQGFAVGANPATTSSASASRTKTQVASIVTASLLLMTIVTRIEILSRLPQAVVAVAVTVSVSHLLLRGEMERFYRSRRVDFALAMVALVGVVVAGVLPGLGIAVFLSLLLVLYRSSQPNIAVLGKIPGHQAYADIAHDPTTQQVAGVLILRPDVALFFANANTMQNHIWSLVTKAGASLQAVIIDLGASEDLDIACTDMLRDLSEELREADIDLLLADVKSATRSRLERTGLLEQIGGHNLFVAVPEAVEALETRGSSC